GCYPCASDDSSTEARRTHINDGHDAACQYAPPVNVTNVPPTVTAPAAQSSNEGASHSFDLGTFSDPGSDSPWSVSVDWGDGSPLTTYQITGSGPASRAAEDTTAHQSLAGLICRPLHVTVTDKDGGADTKTFAVHVN